jgi:hypothetical protein
VFTCPLAVTANIVISQEFFKDPKTGKLNLIVSLSTGSYGPFLPYAFTATDSTLKTWSAPVVLSGISNAGLGYIDTFPVYLKYSISLFICYLLLIR